MAQGIFIVDKEYNLVYNGNSDFRFIFSLLIILRILPLISSNRFVGKFQTLQINITFLHADIFGGSNDS